jgi:transcriptional regulator with XRE-family HTH domain
LNGKPLFEAEMARRWRDPRDAEIAKRLRALRLRRGLSQSALGKVLGVTFQQIQKYERGTNRVTAGRLCRIAEVFDVPVAFFFADIDGHRSVPDEDAVAVEFDLLQTRGAVRLALAYSRITDAGVRLRLLKLAECLANA